MWRSAVRKLSTQPSFRDVKIPVPWGHIAGKWWGPTEKRPILTIHGWQDNCGSFDRLIPLLNQNMSFLAIDLPGHGYSSKLPDGMYYHNMNYPILIQHISQYFQWPTVKLMGHSLGAISSFIYTMLFPERVQYLICIDGLKPLHKENNAPRMAKGVDELLRYNEFNQRTEEPPSYTMEELLAKIPETISREHYHLILQRNIEKSKKHPNKYYFSRDPRLKSRLILNWPHQDLLDGARRVKNPLILFKFTDSGYYENKQYFYDLAEVLKESSSDYTLHYVKGIHHEHLNNPDKISELINQFIDKYDNADTVITEQESKIVQNSIN